MRIKLIKERKDMYFAKILGRSDVYAQGSTPEEAVDNLIDVKKTIDDFRAEQSQQNNPIVFSRDYQTRLPKLQFSSLSFSM